MGSFATKVLRALDAAAEPCAGKPDLVSASYRHGLRGVAIELADVANARDGLAILAWVKRSRAQDAAEAPFFTQPGAER